MWDVPSCRRRAKRIPTIKLPPLLARIEARALVLWIGLAAAAWFFLKLASEMREGETDAFDRWILLALRAPGQPHVPVGPHWLSETMRDITALGGVTLLVLIVTVAAVLLVIHARRRDAAVLAATAIFAQMASNLFKTFYDRTRPDFAIYGDLPATHSFPSGHSTVAATVYLLLAVIIARLEPSLGTKRVVFALAAILIAAIGMSRVYLGVHWPSDVLAGWALGGALALFAGQIFLEKRRSRRN